MIAIYLFPFRLTIKPDPRKSRSRTFTLISCAIESIWAGVFRAETDAKLVNFNLATSPDKNIPATIEQIITPVPWNIEFEMNRSRSIQPGAFEFCDLPNNHFIH